MPWAEPRARFTLLFECFAIDVLRQTTIKAACQILRISWDEAWYTLHRAVGRGFSRKEKCIIPHYGVDGKSAGRAQDYIMIICGLDGSTVEEVTEGNIKQSLINYFDQLTSEQIDAIEVVSTDMSKAYIHLVLGAFPEGKENIVFDRFHIMKHMGEAVDKVRRKECQTIFMFRCAKYRCTYGKIVEIC